MSESNELFGFKAGITMSNNLIMGTNFASGKIDVLEKNEIFVFGSNLAGHHMGGAARAAHQKFGAVWGVGVGMTGQCYAIPTMQGGVDTIRPYVDRFIAFAKANSNLEFLVTRIGCGIAGFKDEEIAPLFKEAMKIQNIHLPKEFHDVIVAPLVKRCFYYKGEFKAPFNDSRDNWWNYERCWIRFHFDDEDYLKTVTLQYIREGLASLRPDDGVPMSMKAVLYNRFCHWGWGETPDTFRSWYENENYTNVSEQAKHSKQGKTYYNPLLIGAILGDIAGSIYEFDPHKTSNVELMQPGMDYTDDTIMTVAVADWILTDKRHTKSGLVRKLQEWGRRYPNPKGAYGDMFSQWLRSDNPKPYNSWGNGAAMRVAAVAFAFETMEETLRVAAKSAEVTHNHPEGIKGAQATAAAIYLARHGESKDAIRKYITDTFGYDLNRTCDDIRPTYHFDGSCQGTVPESIIAFLDSNDYEDALRLCISLGGDADTMGAITGAIAGAFYHKLPTGLFEFGYAKLPEDIKKIIDEFDSLYKNTVGHEWNINAANNDTATGELIRKIESGEFEL